MHESHADLLIYFTCIRAFLMCFLFEILQFIFEAHELFPRTVVAEIVVRVPQRRGVAVPVPRTDFTARSYLYV